MCVASQERSVTELYTQWDTENWPQQWVCVSICDVSDSCVGEWVDVQVTLLQWMDVLLLEKKEQVWTVSSV